MSQDDLLDDQQEMDIVEPSGKDKVPLMSVLIPLVLLPGLQGIIIYLKLPVEGKDVMEKIGPLIAIVLPFLGLIQVIGLTNDMDDAPLMHYGKILIGIVCLLFVWFGIDQLSQVWSGVYRLLFYVNVLMELSLILIAVVVIGIVLHYWGRRPQAASWYQLWEHWLWGNFALVGVFAFFFLLSYFFYENTSLAYDVLPYGYPAGLALIFVVLYQRHQNVVPQTYLASVVVPLSGTWWWLIQMSVIRVDMWHRFQTTTAWSSLVIFIVILILLWQSRHRERVLRQATHSSSTK